MYNSVDENSPFEPNIPELDMALLQKLLQQQAQRRLLSENIAILGCGYVGCAIADYWQKQGHFVTGTTTNWKRVASLSGFVSQVFLMKGDDADAVESMSWAGRDEPCASSILVESDLVLTVALVVVSSIDFRYMFVQRGGENDQKCEFERRSFLRL